MTTRNIVPLQRELLPNNIAGALRRMIFSGDLRPGERLMEVELAEQYGISRAPLREAFQLLIAEGLLTSQPHKGTFVTQLTERDIREIYSLRRALEALAVDLLVDTITPMQIEALTAIVDQMRLALKDGDIATVVDLDMQLHEQLCQFSGHSRLHEAWVRMGGQLRSFFAAAEQLYEDEQIIERHLELIEAIAGGDRERAVEAIQEHISNAADRLLTPGTAPPKS